MKIPTGTKIFEGELATFWFDESGILCALANNTLRNVEKQRQNYVFIREITGGKKVCLLTDTTSSSPQDKETRDYTASEMSTVFSAMAIVSDSAGGRMVANLFLAIKKSPIPIKLFSGEKEAKNWLKQYL